MADSSSDSEDLGPVPEPEQPLRKKRKILKNAELLTANLPRAGMYERSFMHRDVVCQICVSPQTEFVITASQEGIVKFWKKRSEGIEFVKLYRAHVKHLIAMTLTTGDGGRTLATIGVDCRFDSRGKVIDSSLTPALKLFDVANFDLTQMIKLKFVPEAVEFCHGRDSAEGICVAVSEAETGKIHMLTPANADGVPKLTVAQKHNAPVHLMRYLFAVHMVLSFDRKGFMEVWDPDTGAWPTGLKGSKNDTTDNLVDNLANRTVTSPTQNRQFLRFASKTDGTDFYELNKLKTHAIACAVAPNNESFALLCADERIRVFRTRSMKKFKELDESVDCLTIAQNDPGQRALHVDHLDFGKRVAGERELRRSSQLQRVSLSFDESGNFLVYPTLVGVKIVNLVTNQLVALLGKVESSERFLQCALYQAKNAPKTRAGATESMGDRGLDGAETGGQTDGSGGRDPTLFVSSFKRPRFYLFTRREPTEDTVDDVGRDVFNEKPTKEDQMLALASDEKRLGRSAILHTTMGDIEFQLFGTECPKTVENML